MSVDSAIQQLGAREESPAPDRLRPVRIWLYVLALLVLLMVAVGGLTRLTDSGLSITEWKPITGAIPPLSEADWQAEFELYQQIPEFQLQNHWMSVDEFKFIYWWEWGHRFLGRLLGVAFAVPFLVFLFQRRIGRNLAIPLTVLFLLGGFQGFLGWWMVSSGLTERVDVSQYRLAAHLCAASILFAALVYVARRITPARDEWTERGVGWPLQLWLLSVLIFAQIAMGAFVAGLDAGYGFNTWPLMEGALVPPGLWTSTPWWLATFEDHLTVQFTHRILAYVLFAVVVLVFVFARAGSDQQRGWSTILLIVTLLQVALGIATLVLVVPVPLAIGHQGLAFMLLGTAAAALADHNRMARLS